MMRGLANIPFLSIEEANRLNTCEVFSIDDMLYMANTQEQRKKLADCSNLPIDKIDKLVSVADLVRIKGIGINRAILLIEKLNIHSVSTFKTFVHKQEKAEEIAKLLRINKKETNSVAGFGDRLNIVIVPDQPDETEIERQFRIQVENQLKTVKLAIDKYHKTIMIFLIISTTLLVLGFVIRNLNEVINIDKEFNLEYSTKSMFFTTSLITLSASLFLWALGVLFSFWIFLKYPYKLSIVINYKYLPQWLFKTAHQKNEYINYRLDIVNQSLLKSIKPSVFLIGVLMAVYLLIAANYQVEQALYIMRIPTIIAFVLIFYYIFTSLWKSLDLIKDTSYSSIKRRIIFSNSIGVIIFFFIIFVSFIVLFKPAFYGSEQLALILSERVKVSQIELMKSVLDLKDGANVDEHEILITLSSFYDHFRSLTQPYNSAFGFFYTPNLYNLISLLSILLMVALAISFLITHIKLYSLRNAILLIIAIGLSIFLNEFISRQSETIFFIKVGSAGYFVFLFSMSLLIMTYIDTLFEIFSRKTICSNCKFEIADKANFCPHCGINIEI